MNDASPISAELLEQFIRVLRSVATPRLAFLVPDEAASVVGVSPDFFNEHIRPELRVVRRGRKVLVARSELDRWFAENAALTLSRSDT